MNNPRADFEALYLDTRVDLLAYLNRRATAEDAADLLGETYTVAWRKREQLPPGAERRLWLYGVARRLLAEHARRTEAAVEVATRLSATHAAGHRDTGRLADEDAIAAALGSLSEVDRELITLTMWERLTVAEASQVLGLTAGTARVRLHRARTRLARHPRLQQIIEDAEPERATATATT